MQLKSVLVTGASGFIGRALITRLLEEDVTPIAAVRSDAMFESPIRTVRVPDLSPNADYSFAFDNVDVVVHAAARVHVMAPKSKGLLELYRDVNVRATKNLAEQAACAGVRRFVFISSIKVNGESTNIGRRFTADDDPAPRDAYGISKAEAEDALRAIAHRTGLEVVVIRPVLVYGPGVGANFRSMMRWLEAGLPLPFARIRNRRSFVAVPNLVDLIVRCVAHPAATNQTFLVSDGEDLSTPELFHRTALALGKRARLIPVPEHVIRIAAALLGGRHVAERLCGSLVVDIDKTREMLQWSPRVRVDDALAATARHYLSIRTQ